MDDRSHAILNSLDTTNSEAHRGALVAWRDGPLAEWNKQLREVPPAEIRAWRTANPPPVAPTAPLLPASVLRNVAATFGVTVDDLVRHTRGTEVRTVYPAPAVLDRASEALGEEIRKALAGLDWPELPTKPAPASPKPPPARPSEDPISETPPTERPS